MDGRISSFLVARVRDEPRLQRAVVADASGRVIAASHRQWLGGVLRPPPPGAAPREACRDDPAAGPGVLACSFPIRAHFDEGLTLGTLEVAWDVAAVFARVQAENQSTSRAPHLVLMRRDGVVVSAPPAPFPAGIGESLAAAGSRAAALAAEGRQGFLVEPIGGVPHLVGYARSAGVTGWSIVVLETTAVAFAPVDRLRGAVLALGGTVALAAVLLSFLLSGRLTSSVRELDAAARQVAAGDLSVRLEPRSRDEIGSLTRSFDQMVRELARQQGRARRQALRRLADRRHERRAVRRGLGRTHRAGEPRAPAPRRPRRGGRRRPAGRRAVRRGRRGVRRAGPRAHAPRRRGDGRAHPARAGRRPRPGDRLGRRPARRAASCAWRRTSRSARRRRSSSASTPRGRGGRGRQGAVPGRREPRGAHSAERGDRDDRPARRHRPRRQAARVRGGRTALRRVAHVAARRHPRLLAHGGGPGRAGARGLRPAEVPVRLRRPADPAPRARRASRSRPSPTTACRSASSATRSVCGRSS